MNTSLYISSGALNAYQRKLDTAAHNVANVNTVGFKKREATFSENLANQLQNQTNEEQEIGRLTPNGLRTGYGVHLGQTAVNMNQGGAQETGNPFDLMIQGNGFFQISRPSGAYRDGVEEVRYTRDGSFKLSSSPYEGVYNLANAQGDLLLDESGYPIEIEEGYEVNIAENGEIRLINKEDPSDFYTADWRIGVVDIANPQLLRQLGENQYVLREDVLAQGDNIDTWVTSLNLDGEGTPKLRQGFLETSNVDLGKEMSEIMISQRGFQMNARAVSFADQMMGISNGIINR